MNDIKGLATVRAYVDSSIATKVTANESITGATKTKITYDSDGLVTSGADATTADIADSSNKRYVTDAQLTVIGNTSGTNSGDQTLPTDATISTSDVTTNDATTTKHGWLLKATAPSSGLINVVGIANAETSYSNKALFDATIPSTQAYGDSAAAGSATVAARRDHKHAMPAALTDATISTTDVTTSDASTSKHGWLLKATAPSSGLINVVGIANGETVYANKALFDTTAPSTQAYGDTASAGTAVVAARRDHKHAMPASTKDTTAATGILKGNGTAISAASAGTDYVAPGGALGTPSSGTLTNCTFPTLNQDTSGTAAKAGALLSATTTVNVSSATAPSSGQVLTATSSTAATWQTPSGGAVSDGDKGDITVSGSGATWTIDNGVVTEAKLSVSDVTTANASTSMHGLLPKLGGGTTNFLRADGTWAAPPAGGTIAASSVTTTDSSNVQAKLDALATANGDIASALAAILGV